MEVVLLVNERRGSSDADLLPIATEAMRNGLAVSRSSAIIARAAEVLDPDPAVLERIIDVAGGTGHIIGGGERVPEPAALVRMFDVEPGAVVAQLRAVTVLEDRWARARALRAAEQLIIARPVTADDLLPSILDSLVMEDDSHAYPAPFAGSGRPESGRRGPLGQPGTVGSADPGTLERRRGEGAEAVSGVLSPAVATRGRSPRYHDAHGEACPGSTRERRR